MKNIERVLPDSNLPVEAQLFEAVRQVCIQERGVSMEHLEGDKVAEWQAPDGSGVGLHDTALTLPLRQPTFGVKYATLLAGDKDSAFSVRIATGSDTRTLPEGCVPFNYEYDSDPIAREVLSMFKTFLRGHAHERCIDAYRERKQQRLATEAAAVARERQAEKATLPTSGWSIEQAVIITDRRRIA